MNRKYVEKIICLLIGSLVMVISNLRENTYAAFSSSVKSGISFKTASAKDIINIKGVEYINSDVKSLTQAYIIIDKICDEAVTTSFELLPTLSPVTHPGNLSRYVTPPASMVLTNGLNRIPINVIATQDNYYKIAELLNKNKPNDILLTGKVKVYCFNKFVDESIDIQFSARYLKTVLLSTAF